MTFATVIAENGGNSATDRTDPAVNLPDGSNVADRLILVFFTSDGSGETITFPAGWTKILTDGGSGFTSVIFYRVTDGTEGYASTGATITATITSVEMSAHTTYLITDFHTSTAPEVSTATTGTSTAPNSGALNPTNWDVEDTLWFTFCSLNGASASTPRITVYPTNYTNGRSDFAADGNGVTQGVARRENATASEDPGAFTSGTSVAWRAATVGIRPAAASAYTVSNSETATLSEAVSAQVGTSQVSKSESITVSEATAQLITSFVAKSETITLSESVTAQIASTVNASEAVTLSETVGVAVSAPQISKSETVTLSEAVTAQIATTVNTSEAVTVSEATAQLITSFVAKSETVTLSESVAAQIATTVNASETVTVSETVGVVVSAPQISKSETVTLSEAVSVVVVSAGGLAISVSETVTLSESHAESVGALQVSKTESVTISEAVNVTIAALAINQTETITVTEIDAAYFSSNVSVSEAISVTDAGLAGLFTSYNIHAVELITVQEEAASQIIERQSQFIKQYVKLRRRLITKGQ